MSIEYNQYLEEHIGNVKKAYEWLCEHLPYIKESLCPDARLIDIHDASKRLVGEYGAYDRYFYGNNRSFLVVQEFKHAWLLHIHRNPHHWQHWVLIHDDEPMEALQMPSCHIVEMICDWWSFSFKSGNLYEIFDWYEKHKDGMILHRKTRSIVESILADIKVELDKGDG